MKRSLALQTWTLRNRLRYDAESVLRGIRETGFEYLELAGTAGQTLERFGSLCRELGFTIIGVHAPPLTSGKLANVIDEIRLQCSAFGSPRATVMLEPYQRETLDGYFRYAELCCRAGEGLRKSGIELSYHCYHYDLVPVGDRQENKTGLDILLEKTSPETLTIELDTYWTEIAGLSIKSLMDKCADRCKLIHVNDCDDKGHQAPLGSGRIDWFSVLDVLEEVEGVEWCILEHDTPTPEDWIRQSCQYWGEVQAKHLATRAQDGKIIPL